MSTSLDEVRPRIIAGLGCRAGVAAAELLALIDQALRTSPYAHADLVALATPEFKRAEPALIQAAAGLGVPLLFADQAALAAVAPLCPTRSAAAEQRWGVASIAEGAALAAAGPGAHLAVPRIKSPAATCALAVCARLSHTLANGSTLANRSDFPQEPA